MSERPKLNCTRGAIAAVLASVLVTPAAADVLTDFFERHVDFSKSEIQAVRSGEAVTKLLDTSMHEEVAVFGAVWINGSVSTFVELYKDIETFEGGSNVDGIGLVSSPPKLSDFDTLELTEDDIKDIKKCRPGKCEVKMSEESMQRFQEEVDWSAKNAHDQANSLARRLALELVEAYLHGGNAELGQYQDKKLPQQLEVEFRGLLENSPYLLEYEPELHNYLDRFPEGKPDGVTDFLYWSRVKFGLKPFVRLNHVTIYESPVDGSMMIASKQLYSSHYFRAALELRSLVKDPENPDREGFYLLSLNRARSDGLTGMTGILLRGTVKERSRKGLETFLLSAKNKVESQ